MEQPDYFSDSFRSSPEGGRSKTYRDSQLLQNIRFRHASADVIRPPDIDIGMYLSDYFLRSRGIAKQYLIDAPQGGKQAQTCAFLVDQGSWFQDEFIGDHRYFQYVTEHPCFLQMHEVPDMQKIENTVTENNFHARKFALAGAGVTGNVTRPSR